MTRAGRLTAETRAAATAFLRRRTAVFFTFLFPVIIVVIFGVVVQTQSTGRGLFAEPAGWYVPGYLAVVVLFTPLSRVGSEVARHRDGNRFEKLATTPLTRPEWLLAHALVNVAIIGLAAVLLLALVLAVTDAAFTPSVLLVPYLAVGVALFCGVGALLGRLAGSQDGVIAAANGVALPLLFLSPTFVTPDLLPAWFRPLLALSPLTYFVRGVRAATYETADALPTAGVGRGVVGTDPYLNLLVLVAVAAGTFAAGARALPRTD